MTDQFRKIKIWSCFDQNWRRINPEDLSLGDVFKMYEPDGTPVLNENGGDVFMALCNSHLNNEHWTVTTRPWKVRFDPDTTD